MAKGIIYAMTTVVPGLIKIGKTGSDSFEQRMYNLEHNGYSNVTGLKREFAIEVDDYDEKELLLHNIFSKSRVDNTELFALDIHLVVKLLSSFEGKQVYPKNTSKIEVFEKTSIDLEPQKNAETTEEQPQGLAKQEEHRPDSLEPSQVLQVNIKNVLTKYPYFKIQKLIRQDCYACGVEKDGKFILLAGSIVGNKYSGAMDLRTQYKDYLNGTLVTDNITFYRKSLATQFVLCTIHAVNDWRECSNEWRVKLGIPIVASNKQVYSIGTQAGQNEYELGKEGSWTGKRIKYIKVFGTRYDVKSAADALVKTLEVICKQDGINSQRLKNNCKAIKDNEKDYTGTADTPRMIPGTNVYVDIHSNSDQKRDLILRALRITGISKNNILIAFDD